MRMQKASFLSLLALVCAFGCSILNAPEDLLPPEDVTGDGDGDGDGDMGGSSGDGDGDGTGGGDGDIPDPPEAPTTGLIVVTGVETASDDRVLLTINPLSGAELSRETVPAVSVAYDEAPGRFVWYIFTSASPSPGANTLAELQVRRYDDDTDTWTTVSRTSALPAPLLRGEDGAAAGPRPTAHFKPVVLNERLVYISQTVEMGSPVQSVTVLDTSDLRNVELVETRPIPPMDQVMGLVGRRGTELDAEAPGGAISLMVAQACDAVTDVCNLAARPLTISNNIAELTPDNFGTFLGVPAFASTPVLPDSEMRPFKNEIESLGAYALAFHPGTNEPRWWGFDPADPAAKEVPSSLPDSASDSFAGLAVWECRAAAVASSSGSADDELSAIHLANASVLSTSLVDIGRDVTVEPFRGNALTMRSPGSDFPAIRAFQIEVLTPGTPTERISLAERALWNAPEDVDPLSFAVRLPESPSCSP